MKFGSLMILLAFFAVLPLSCYAQGASLGVSPAKIDLGLVEPGSTRLVNFYVVTPSNETLLVNIEPETVVFDASSITKNTSEENFLDWIRILDNPVELKPTETLQTASQVIKSQRQVSFLIEIPQDAEPGLHVFNIKPVLVQNAGEIGTVGGSVMAVTSVKVSFYVAGDPERKGVILDAEDKYSRDGSVSLDTYFQNTGSVTVAATGRYRIYDSDGTLLLERGTGRFFVGPGEIKTFASTLPDASYEGDTVYTTVDYKTGVAENNFVVRIAPATALVAGENEASNMLPIFLLIAIIAFSVIIYRRVK